MNSNLKPIVLGIDLGTTNSLAAWVNESGVVEVVQNEQQTSHTPSFVCVLPEATLVGTAAKSQRVQKPESTFFSFKRFMGRGSKDVQGLNMPFPIQVAERDRITIGGFSPEELSAEVLKAVKTKAESILNRPIFEAVITVPAYFDDVQRNATRNAAQIAGLKALRILNEPTAAAIAYGLDSKQLGKIVVYDFGGGTFDVSILHFKNKLFKVLATEGNTQLGGDDIDELIVQKLAETAQAKPSAELQQFFKQVAENIKIQLSQQLEAEVDADLPNSNKKLKLSLSREQFDPMIQPLVSISLQHVQNALDMAGLKPNEINEIVLVGGSTRIPLVRKMVEQFFQKTPHTRVNPEQVVALGAGMQAHVLSGGKREFLLMDVIPLSLGIETIGGTFSKLILKNASIPAQAKETFSTSVDNQTAIEINIYQGEREFVKDCRFLGKFKLRNIPSMPAGLPRMELSFQIDANGILSVQAIELRSQQQAEIEIIPQHGLNPAQVQQMIEQSITHAEQDFTQRTLVEFRQKAQSMIKGLDKIWDAARDSLTKEQQQTILQSKANLQNSMQQEQNPFVLKTALDNLANCTTDLSDQWMSKSIQENLK